MLPGPGARRLTLGIIPEGGAHIDVPRKTVGAWQTADTMGIFQALPASGAGGGPNAGKTASKSS